MTRAADALAAGMTEDALLRAVRDYAEVGGWLAYHTHDSRHSDAGFPDLVLVHPLTDRLLFVELKATTGRLRCTQRAWLDALRGAGMDVRVWRPSDLDEAFRVLVEGSP